MKKLFLGLGTATAVLVPIVSVVSCTNRNEEIKLSGGKVRIYYDVVGNITAVEMDSTAFLKKGTDKKWTIDRNGMKSFVKNAFNEYETKNVNKHKHIIKTLKKFHASNNDKGGWYFTFNIYFHFGGDVIAFTNNGNKAKGAFLLWDGQYIWADKTTKKEDDRGSSLSNALAGDISSVVANLKEVN